MTANFGYVDAPTLMGSWPMAATGVLGPSRGDFTLFPKSFISQATVLAGRQDPAGGFDVNGKSFDVDVDGSGYSVAFTSGPMSLDSVVSEINSDVGLSVAFNDNGFLRLKSPTIGDGSSLEVTPDVSGPGILAELGILSGSTSYAGDIQQAQHVDPKRGVATTGQLAPNYGETFDETAFNRLAFQLALNCDRSARLIDSKRVAIQAEHQVPSYSPGGTPGITLAQDVYVGTTSTPSATQLERLFAVLDTDGNEYTEEVEDVTDTTNGTTDTVEADFDESAHVQYVVLGGTTPSTFTAVDDTDNVYVRLSGVTAAPSANNKLFKIIEYVSGLKVGIKSIDPATGARIEFDEGPTASIVLERVEVTPTGVVVEEVQASVGGARVENVAQSRTSSTAITRIERNNRVVCMTADFVSDGVIVGDRIQISSAGQDIPYLNDGWYRILSVVDENTVELMGDDYTPVFLNSVKGTGYGNIVIQSDGAFFNTPFLKFNFHPTTGASLDVVYMGLSNIRDASDDPTFMGGGGIRYTQEATADIQHALLAVIGPSATSLGGYLHDDARNSLENLYYRISKEHDDIGKHTTIYPDEVWVGPEDTGSDTAIPKPYVYISDNGRIETAKVGSQREVIEFNQYSNGSPNGGPRVKFNTSYGDWLVNAETQDGHTLAEIVVYGRDSGDSEGLAAKLLVVQDGASGVEVPGRFEFHLATDDDAAVESARLSGQANAVEFNLYGYNQTPTADPRLILSKSNSSPGSMSLATTDPGDYLGSIVWEGVDTGSNREVSAFIRNIQSGASGVKVPSYLMFAVGTDTVAPAEVMRITSAAVLPGTTKNLGGSSDRWNFGYFTTLNVDSAGGNGVQSDLVPTQDKAYALGNASYRWENLSVSDFLGDGVIGHFVPAGSGYNLGNTSQPWLRLFISDAAGQGVANNLVPAVATLDLGNVSYPWDALFMTGAASIGNTAVTASYLNVRDTFRVFENADTNHYGYINATSALTAFQGISLLTDKIPLYVDCLHTGAGTPAGNTDIFLRVGPSSAPVTGIKVDESGRIGLAGDEHTTFKVRVQDTLLVDTSSGTADILSRNLGSGDAYVRASTGSGTGNAYMWIDRSSTSKAGLMSWRTGGDQKWVTGFFTGHADTTFEIARWDSNIRVFMVQTDGGSMRTTVDFIPLAAVDNGTSGNPWSRGYFDKLYHRGIYTTWDDYDDLELVDGYSPSGETVEMKKGEKLHKVQLADPATLPWPCLSEYVGEDGMPFIDTSSSIGFVLGAIKQLHKKHKKEVDFLKKEIEELKVKVA